MPAPFVAVADPHSNQEPAPASAPLLARVGRARPGGERQPDLRAVPLRVRWVLGLLQGLRHGTLSCELPDGQVVVLGAGDGSAPRADLRIADWGVVDDALRRGDVGFAAAHAEGRWSSRDPVALLRFFLRNRDAADRLIHGSVLGGLLDRLRHLAHANRRAQARRNIAAHYDLGNDFYALWLDRTTTYSSALFDHPIDLAELRPVEPEQLARAQEAKLDRVLRALALPPGGTVLEIGCGWGSFAERAARAGHPVTAVTLSAAQLEVARARLARTGRPHQARLQDYRDLDGRYDGVASIEMFEAVGERYWPAYFAAVARSLRTGARACIQTITIDHARFARYRRGTDFIQQCIFPGGMLPSAPVFEAAAARAGLRVVDRFDFGAHYALTLATWRERFTANLAQVRALGFDEPFIRNWTFYLAYCEAAFAEGATDVVQYTLARD